MMKKITLLLILLAMSFGYSQSLPFDFSDPAHLMTGDGGTVTSLTTDPDNASDDVMQMIGATAAWDNAQIDFAENVDLSDDANNTITFRIKPVNDTGSGNHLLKFELGTTGDTELPFTTTGTAWQTISLDFPAGLGNYGRIVIFTDSGDANAGVSDTYLIDDLAGGTNVAPPADPEAFLPIDFSDAYELFAGQDAVTSLTTDPDNASDDVMQIIGATAAWDNAKIEFAKNVDLSDDANNTITFRIKPINDTGSGNHLLKFELGTTGDTELPFTTTGTAWQTISLDFPAGLGNYGRMVIFTDSGDANAGVSDTYLVDDFAGATNIEPAVPPAAATNPTTPAANVFNIYSDTGGYTGGFDYAGGCFGALGGEPDLDTGAGTNLAWEFDFGAQGFGCTNSSTVDVSNIGGSPIAYVSFQYYTDNANDFYIDMISGPGGSTVESFYYIGTNAAGDAPAEDIAIVQGSWQHVVIGISEFTNQVFDPTELFQFKFDVYSNQGPGTVYIDNVMLSSVAPTLNDKDFELSSFKAYPNPTQDNWTVKSKDQIISSIEVYDILGKQVLTMSTDSREVSIDGSSLKTGLYFAQIKTDSSLQSIKLVKK